MIQVLNEINYGKWCNITTTIIRWRDKQFLFSTAMKKPLQSLSLYHTYIDFYILYMWCVLFAVYSVLCQWLHDRLSNRYIVLKYTQHIDCRNPLILLSEDVSVPRVNLKTNYYRIDEKPPWVEIKERGKCMNA